jgi:hypothetical protein
MSGTEKKPVLVIGKANNLPVQYHANSKRWMTGGIFEEWLHNLDMKFKREHRSVVLFLDNSAHPHDIKLHHVRIVFIPPNTTSKLQPCDQGIISNFKQSNFIIIYVF